MADIPEALSYSAAIIKIANEGNTVDEAFGLAYVLKRIRIPGEHQEEVVESLQNFIQELSTTINPKHECFSPLLQAIQIVKAGTAPENYPMGAGVLVHDLPEGDIPPEDPDPTGTVRKILETACVSKAFVVHIRSLLKKLPPERKPQAA